MTMLLEKRKIGCNMIGKINRITSSMVLIAFLLNTFLFDVGFAQELNPGRSTDTLAPAGRTDDIIGTDNTDMLMISTWFMGCMSYITDKGLSVTLDNIKDENIIPDRVFESFREFEIFRHEAISDPETGVITLMARKLDHTGKTYTIEYDPSLGLEGIRVYPREEKRVANNGAKRSKTIGRFVKAPEEGEGAAKDPQPLSEAQKSAAVLEAKARAVATVIVLSNYLQDLLNRSRFFTFSQYLKGCEEVCKAYPEPRFDSLIFQRKETAKAGLGALVAAGILQLEIVANTHKYSLTEASKEYLDSIRKQNENSGTSNVGSSKESEGAERKIVKMDESVVKTIIELLADKKGLRSQDSKQVFRSALALANLAGQVKLSKGSIESAAKSLIGPEGLQNRKPERVFQAALAFVNIAATAKLNETGIQTIIDSLIGLDGLQGSDPLRAYQATRALAKLAADRILNDDKMDRIINSLKGKNGLQSPDPRRVLRASIALAGFADYPRLGKDIPRAIVELLTVKNGMLRSGASWEVFQASLVLARFADKGALDRDAKRILLESLVGTEGLRSGNIASTFLASIAITDIAGKGIIERDTIKALEIFLKSGDGLKSQSKFYSFLAALNIANTADRMELNNNTLGDVITLLLSSEGLRNSDPWRIIFASESLVNLKTRLDKLPKQPRSAGGTFDERPGKGPLAARLVIGVSPYIQGLLESQGFFTLNDYKIGYEEVRRRSPELNFERLTYYWQKTARRDLADLDAGRYANGILVIDRTEKELKYQITESFYERLRRVKEWPESAASTYVPAIKTTLKPFATGIVRTVQEERYNIFRIGSDEDYFEITDFGAAVTRLVSGGKNMIWQGTGGEKVKQDDSAFAVPGGIPVMIPVNGRTPLGDILKQDGQTPVNILKSSLARPVDGVNPLDNEACKHLLHGITDKVRWHMRNTENDSITFSITSEEVVLDVEGAKTLADIIGKVSFEQTYRLKDGRLTSELTMTNMDVAPVVLGGGYHPFYQLDDLEDWTIQVKAGKVWAKDSTPLDINAKPEDVSRGGEWDFSTPKPLRYGLEVVLSGLESEASGNVEIVLHNMKTGENRRIAFDKEHFPHVLIWVPTLDKAPAPGVFSVEPLITIPNGRNMFLKGNKEVEALALQPGESKTIIWELQVGVRSAENAPAPADEDIVVMTEIASQAGLQIPTDHANRYTLLVPREFFANGEMDAHKNTYGDRFNLDAVSGSTAEQFITNVLSNSNLAKDRTIVLLPSELANGKFGSEHYEALKAAGIRFTIVDRQQLLEAKSRLLNPKQKKRELEYRKQFWTDTYTVMILMRAMDEKTDPNSPIYRLLSFYLKTHFSFTDKIALEAYIMAIAKNDIGNILKGILAYRPIQVYDKPDYGMVAATLISA